MEGISSTFEPKKWHIQTVKNTPTQQKNVESAKTDEFVSANDKKERKKIIIGTSVALLLASYGAIFYRKNISNMLDEFIKKMYLKKNKIKEHGLNGLSKIELLSYNLARLMDKTLMSTQMFVNFSAMKDSISNRLAHALKMGKLCNKLSAYWEKLASKAVITNYNKCDKSLTKTQQSVSKIVEQIRKTEDLSKIIVVDGKNYTLSEILVNIEKNMRDSRNMYNQDFSLNAFKERTQILKESLQKVSDKFSDTYTKFDYYKNLEFTRFTVEEWLAPVKSSYQNHLTKNKIKISNSLDDKFVSTYQLLKNFDKTISANDASSRKILKGIFKQLKEYRNAIGKDEVHTRELLHADIERHLDLLTKKMKSNNVAYSDDTIKYIDALAQDIKNSLSKNDKGKLQETLTYLKAILPKQEYQTIRGQFNKTADNFTKITTAEGDLYFDKLRDIVLGSAFTDIVFGMVSPLATMGLLLALDDTKEERISTTLKLGIPLVGGIATSTAFLFLLASGGKALILSSLIGLGLNRIGTYADNKIAENRNKEKNADIKSIVNDVNLASTLLASGGSDIIIQKTMNKGLSEVSKIVKNKRKQQKQEVVNS